MERTMKVWTAGVMVAALVALIPGAMAQGSAEDGEQVFKKCSACHKIGPDAKECVPLLLDLLKSDDAYLRNRAGAALKMIDPEAAAAAGVK